MGGMPMRPVFAAVALCVAANSTPAFADKYFAVTPSGAAEMAFPDDPPTVIGNLSSKCIDNRWTVISSTSNSLVCEAPLNMGQSILGQMLLGNSYSTPPRRFFRFNVAEVNGVSRVQASSWMELQMAFGQTQRQDFSGPQFQNNIELFMGSAGGKYPLGTTFPNHAAMGVQVANVQLGKYAGFRITEISPDSAAAKAGMQVGDVVTRIAGKQFKTIDDYLDATAKAAESATYDVELTRDGKRITLRLDRAFRSPITESVVAKTTPAVQAMTPTAPISVADELQKLLKLKEQGILTDAEFEAQKRKLLGEQ